MKKLRILFIVAPLMVAPLLPLTAASTAKPERVKIDNFNFTPQTLKIHAGTTVTWVNQDDVPHTVTSTDKKFKSGALDTNEKFTYTFTKPGTYNYFCSVHPHMTGKILVQ